MCAIHWPVFSPDPEALDASRSGLREAPAQITQPVKDRAWAGDCSPRSETKALSSPPDQLPRKAQVTLGPLG